MNLLDNEKLLQYFEVPTVDDLFVAVTGRKPAAGAIVEYLKIKRPIAIPDGPRVKTAKGNDCPVYCKGVGKIAIALANCCTPIPGDDIVGYITKGKGISVHRKNCPNIAKEKERLVDVYWRKDLQFATYPVDIAIEASDRPNLIIDIMFAMTSNKATVSNIHANLASNYRCKINLTLLVSDAKINWKKIYR